MNRHQLLEHTADIGIEAWGESRAALYAEAARALREVIVGSAPVENRESREVRAAGRDDAERLVAWLGEVLFLFESRQFLPAAFEFHFAGEEVRARIGGELLDPERHPVEREVKAITHHQVLAEQIEGGWHARLYLDL